MSSHWSKEASPSLREDLDTELSKADISLLLVLSLKSDGAEFSKPASLSGLRAP